MSTRMIAHRLFRQSRLQRWLTARQPLLHTVGRGPRLMRKLNREPTRVSRTFSGVDPSAFAFDFATAQVARPFAPPRVAPALAPERSPSVFPSQVAGQLVVEDVGARGAEAIHDAHGGQDEEATLPTAAAALAPESDTAWDQAAGWPTSPSDRATPDSETGVDAESGDAQSDPTADVTSSHEQPVARAVTALNPLPAPPTQSTPRRGAIAQATSRAIPPAPDAISSALREEQPARFVDSGTTPTTGLPRRVDTRVVAPAAGAPRSPASGAGEEESRLTANGTDAPRSTQAEQSAASLGAEAIPETTGTGPESPPLRASGPVASGDTEGRAQAPSARTESVGDARVEGVEAGAPSVIDAGDGLIEEPAEAPTGPVDARVTPGQRAVPELASTSTESPVLHRGRRLPVGQEPPEAVSNQTPMVGSERDQGGPAPRRPDAGVNEIQVAGQGSRATVQSATGDAAPTDVPNLPAEVQPSAAQGVEQGGPTTELEAGFDSTSTEAGPPAHHTPVPTWQPDEPGAAPNAGVPRSMFAESPAGVTESVHGPASPSQLAQPQHEVPVQQGAPESAPPAAASPGVPPTLESPHIDPQYVVPDVERGNETANVVERQHREASEGPHAAAEAPTADRGPSEPASAKSTSARAFTTAQARPTSSLEPSRVEQTAAPLPGQMPMAAADVAPKGTSPDGFDRDPPATKSGAPVVDGQDSDVKAATSHSDQPSASAQAPETPIAPATLEVEARQQARVGDREVARVPGETGAAETAVSTPGTALEAARAGRGDAPRVSAPQPDVDQATSAPQVRRVVATTPEATPSPDASESAHEAEKDVTSLASRTVDAPARAVEGTSALSPTPSSEAVSPTSHIPPDSGPISGEAIVGEESASPAENVSKQVGDVGRTVAEAQASVTPTEPEHGSFAQPAAPETTSGAIEEAAVPGAAEAKAASPVSVAFPSTEAQAGEQQVTSTSRPSTLAQPVSTERPMEEKQPAGSPLVTHDTAHPGRPELAAAASAAHEAGIPVTPSSVAESAGAQVVGHGDQADAAPSSGQAAELGPVQPTTLPTEPAAAPMTAHAERWAEVAQPPVAPSESAPTTKPAGEGAAQDANPDQIPAYASVNEVIAPRRPPPPGFRPGTATRAQSSVASKNAEMRERVIEHIAQLRSKQAGVEKPEQGTDQPLGTVLEETPAISEEDENSPMLWLTKLARATHGRIPQQPAPRGTPQPAAQPASQPSTPMAASETTQPTPAGTGPVQVVSSSETTQVAPSATALSHESGTASPRRADPATAQFGRPPAQAAPPTPLPESTRQFLQPLVGIDPATVQVYHNAAAERATSALNVDAFAVGDTVALSAGNAPSAPETLGLLAHELTHVARARQPRFVPPVMTSSVGAPFIPPLGTTLAPRPVASDSPDFVHVPTDEEAVAGTVESRVTRAARQAEAREFSPTAPVSPGAAQVPSVRPMGAPGDGAARRERQDWGGLPAPWEPLPEWFTAMGGGSMGATPSVPQTFAAEGQGNAGAMGSQAAIQFAETTRSASAESSDEGGHATEHGHRDAQPAPDLDQMAKQVYEIIKRRLTNERRRGF